MVCPISDAEESGMCQPYAAHLMCRSQPSQRSCSAVSKLFRNVPFLTSIEMSPFSFCTSFCFFRLLLLKNFSLASPRSDDPLLGRTRGSMFFCPVGLARSVALRSPQGEAL